MYQQPRTVQDHDNKAVYKASPRYAQSFVGILQAVWGVVYKIGTTVLHGFHSFVASAEQPSSSQNDYWWNSPKAVDDLFNR